MKKVFQPYESHVQYLLQWMCDYNLYGCTYIDCKEVKFRSPIPDYLDSSREENQWHDHTIPPSYISDEKSIPRQSYCSIEVDICVQNILNRLDVKARQIHHDFAERNYPVEAEAKLVQSMASLWRDETRRRKLKVGETNPGCSPFPPEVLVSVSADPRTSQSGNWIHEMEYAQKIQNIIKDEKDKSDGRKISFDNLLTKVPFEKFVKTSLESVEDLFPENLSYLSTEEREFVSTKRELHRAIIDEPEVDESRILSFQEDGFPYESDEELARELGVSQIRQGDGIDDPKRETVTEGQAELINKPTNFDKTKLDEDATRITVGGANSLSPHQELQGTGNPAHYQMKGIRVPGDPNKVVEDAFDIPLEFAGRVEAKRARDSKSGSGPERKRRKISHGEAFSNLCISQAGQHPPVSGHPDTPGRPINDQTTARVVTNLKGRQITSSSNSDKAQQPYRLGYDKVESLSSAQETSVRRLENGNLSFPVVKDPQDSHTISKLQRSFNSTTRSSQKSKATSVSFPIHNDFGSKTSSPQRSGSSSSFNSPTLIFPQVLPFFSQLRLTFSMSIGRKFLCSSDCPPVSSELLQELRSTRLPSVIYRDAHYSDAKDVPERAREYGGRKFRVESSTVAYLPDFDPTGTSLASKGANSGVVVDKLAEEKFYQRRRITCGLRTWEIEELPPMRQDVESWLYEEHQAIPNSSVGNNTSNSIRLARPELSQIDGVTQKNKYGFKYSQKQESTSVQHEAQYMSIMSLEIHVNTRANLAPDPEHDEISCVFWCLKSDDEAFEVNGINEGTHLGVLALSEEGGLAHQISKHTTAEVEEESSELDLINRMVDIVRNYDPDILAGYEVHGGSWGYIIERARCKYDYNLCDELSRMKSQSHGRFGKNDDRWGFNHTSTIRVTGRHMINIWRAMRAELTLLQYTMENVVFQLCHRRIPHYGFHDLTSWYGSGKPANLARVIEYYISRVQIDLEILEQNELVPRTSEQARLLGVDFFSVFSRGSQYKVESLMFRIAKPESFLLPSPSRKQVGQQNALECLPLVMEPQSAFYNSPLLVLDFQSLYPSVMIAYNYCYSTFLGRAVSWRGQNKMGFTNYHREPRLLELLKDQINIAPNGILYVKPEIRKSLLAKMLGEILETRVMVKSGMKVDKDDKNLQRLLNNRQLALKLIANVTYGYTSASFSGRMPCSEIADSIVQTGRETLEKAIALIHSVERWGAEVVYGDTDSLFVYLKGRTKDEAFDIGQEIAKTITDMNPRPIKLKFEKVYFPCVLLAKKRYVGFKYESKLQKTPDFDAKGIETVRRDGTPAEQRIEERALKILFRTADLSQVKDYFQRQCMKIMKGKVSIQDFCFAKEVKLGTYSDKGLPPPGALISMRRMLEDPRAEPQYGERVPFLVIAGAPGARLKDRCVAPEVLLDNDYNELDAEYYISKNLIPPLERIFNLVGANVRQWYDEMPKYQRIRRIKAGPTDGEKDSIRPKKTLESYMKSSSCLVCYTKLKGEVVICGKCMRNKDTSLLALYSTLNELEKKAVNLEMICRSCAGLAWGEEIRCDSKDCPVFYTRSRHMSGLRSNKMVIDPVISMLQGIKADDALKW